MTDADDGKKPEDTPDAKRPKWERASREITATPSVGCGIDDLPDPPDWLAEESARRQHLKQLMLSEVPWLLEFDALDRLEFDEIKAPEPDGPDFS